MSMAAVNNMLQKYGALDAVFGDPQYAKIPMAVVRIVISAYRILRFPSVCFRVVL